MTTITKKENFINLDMKCSLCNRKITLQVRNSDLQDFKHGIKKVQNCFSYLTPSERELFLSGYCEKCWEKCVQEPK